MMQPKPINNNGNKVASDAYNKYREISEKYSKLPLKPGFKKPNIRLNQLSIDVNTNDYVNSSIMSTINGNISNRNNVNST
jgi:hypothetical protein